MRLVDKLTGVADVNIIPLARIFFEYLPKAKRVTIELCLSKSMYEAKSSGLQGTSPYRNSPERQFTSQDIAEPSSAK